MAGVINTGSFPKALWEGVRAWWDSAAKGTPEYWNVMYRKEKSTKNYEEYVQAVGLGIAPRKPEGQPISFDTMQQGFVTRGTNAAYGLGIITIAADLLKEVGILANELVHVVNINNGTRIETYVIEGEAGSGVCCCNIVATLI